MELKENANSNFESDILGSLNEFTSHTGRFYSF